MTPACTQKFILHFGSFIIMWQKRLAKDSVPVVVGIWWPRYGLGLNSMSWNTTQGLQLSWLRR